MTEPSNRAFQIRPAEWLIIGFTLLSALILFVLRPGMLTFSYFGAFPWMEILAMLAAAFGLKAWRLKRAGSRIRLGSDVRTAAPMVLIMFFYPLIPALIMALGREDQDAFLHDWDLRLFGDVIVSMQSWISLPLSTWMAACYSVYGFLVLLVFAWFCTRNENSALDEFVFEFTLTMVIGYVGYILMPAIGPLYTLDFSVPIDLPIWMSEFKHRTMDVTKIDRDCFPSLHTAISLICWFQIRDHFRKLSLWIAPVVFTIPLACLYLRYHYAVDVVMGVLLAFGVRFIAKH